jgi:hypothetical protein
VLAARVAVALRRLVAGVVLLVLRGLLFHVHARARIPRSARSALRCSELGERNGNGAREGGSNQPHYILRFTKARFARAVRMTRKAHSSARDGV